MSLDGLGEQISGWDDASLRETGLLFHGDGADAGLSDLTRFQTNIAKLIRRRMANVELPGEPSIFLLSSDVPEELSSKKKVPMLNNGITSIESHFWFVGPVAAQGVGSRISTWEDSEVFSQLEDIGHGLTPAILYETRTKPPTARFFPNGVSNPDNYQLLMLESSNVTLQDILEKVDFIYEHSLKTPTAQHAAARLWKSPSKHWPHSNAESRISLYLREGLQCTYASCTIREEQTQPSGRLDLELEEPSTSDPSTIIRHAILELKVLRDYGSTGVGQTDAKNKEIVEEGVRQAASYRTDRKSRASALCCFDMRKEFTGDACFAHVTTTASHNQVELRAWHIFSSTAEYRRHDVPTLEAEIA